jgi:hypothetical protein
MIRGSGAILLFSAVLTACADGSVDSMAPQLAAYNFTNGPSELPHVLRSGGRVISAFLDFDQDMVVVVGAPDDPATDRVCDGSEPRQFIPVQWVGDFEGMVKQLAMLAEINVLVYQPIPATLTLGLCATEPIATGTGRYLRTDNDFFGAFGRANAVLELVQGTVELADGGQALLSARFNALGSPAGELRRFETTIRLLPLAQPE